MLYISFLKLGFKNIAFFFTNDRFILYYHNVYILDNLGNNLAHIHIYTYIHIQSVFNSVQFSSFQSLSRVWLFVTPWATACQVSLFITNSQSPPKLMYWASDAIQPSHFLPSPSPPAFNLSQHQGLFKWVSPLHQMAKVWEFQLQDQSFQWTSRTDFL